MPQKKYREVTELPPSAVADRRRRQSNSVEIMPQCEIGLTGHGQNVREQRMHEGFAGGVVRAAQPCLCGAECLRRLVDPAAAIERLADGVETPRRQPRIPADALELRVQRIESVEARRITQSTLAADALVAR